MNLVNNYLRLISFILIAVEFFAFSQLKVVRIAGEPFPYLLTDQLRKIPDNETLIYMGYKFEDLELLAKDSILKFAKGKDLESMIRQNGTPDEVMRVSSLKLKTLQNKPDLIKNLMKVGDFFNPSLLPFKGRILVACGTTEGIKFTWLDVNFQPINDDYLGIGPGLTHLKDTVIVGGDARLVMLGENHIMLACTGWYGPIRMKVVELFVNVQSNILQAGAQMRLNPIPVIGIGKMDHKNWSPFCYNSTVLFVESTNPLKVLRTETQDDFNIATSVVSEEPYALINWPYGSIRGGSPAKLIGADTYLTFIHSRLTLDFNARVTYFFGAVTFSATPPFRLTSISRVPIHNDAFYMGPWDHIRFYDYVLYPMNFFFDSGVEEISGPCGRECLEANNITLSMGMQDGEGWVATLNLLELMDTLVPIP